MHVAELLHVMRHAWRLAAADWPEGQRSTRTYSAPIPSRLSVKYAAAGGYAGATHMQWFNTVYVARVVWRALLAGMSLCPRSLGVAGLNDTKPTHKGSLGWRWALHNSVEQAYAAVVAQAAQLGAAMPHVPAPPAAAPGHHCCRQRTQ